MVEPAAPGDDVIPAPTAGREAGGLGVMRTRGHDRAVAMVRSMVVTLRRGGVRWRDTFYPIAQLREGAVR